MPSDDWLQKSWRPYMAVTYMAICIFDFILFPIAWTTLQAILDQTLTQWSPITLVLGGIFHAAMGAVLGVAAWTRGKEKIERMSKRETTDV